MTASDAEAGPGQSWRNPLFDGASVNSIGNLAGFAGPYAVGLLKDATGGYATGLLALTAAGLGGTFVVLLLPHDPSLEHPPLDET